MSPSTLPLPALSIADLAPLRVEQYHEMIATGILGEGEAIELLNGLLTAKERGGQGMPIGPRHQAVVLRMTRACAELDPSLCHWRPTGPITLPPWNEPEPDGVIAAGSPETFLDHHPGASEVSAIVEVADSSLARDRGIKQQIYAQAGIPQYVILHLRDGRAEIYEEPDRSAGAYKLVRFAVPGDALALLLPEGRRYEIAVARLLDSAS